MRKDVQPSIYQQFRGYGRQVWQYASKNIIVLSIITIVNACLEAFGLWLLVPFMFLAGIGANSGQETMPHFFAELLLKYDYKTGLLYLLFIYLAVNILQAVLQRQQSVRCMAVRAGFSRQLSDRLYHAFALAKWQFIISRRRADVVHALTNDLRNIDLGTYFIIQMLIMLPIALAQVAIALFLSPQITCLTIILSAVFFFLLRKNNNKLRDCALSMHDLMQKSLSVVSEHLEGIKEVKSYGAEDNQIARFSHINKNVETRYLQFADVYGWASFFYKIGTVFAICIFFFVALVFMQMSAAGIVVILIIFSRIWPFFSMIQSGSQFSIMMLPSWGNFQAWIDDCNSACEEFCMDKKDSIAGEPLINIKKGITFENVSFSYETGKAKALSNVSFHMPQGTITAVTGTSGSGKSTLADVILGLLKPQEGNVLIDDMALNGEVLLSWRHSIGFVPQETFLFNSTIKENLLWAKPDATEDEIKEALQLASADEFISRMPRGIETPLGERGGGLSGGEKQRIALARAFLRKPTLLILDEATSSLDVKNEERIQAAIDNLRGKMTVLLIAHRLSTIKNSDQILVLDNGCIAEQGKISELMQKKEGKFFELAAVLGRIE